jgi:hypothetical protein
MTKAQAKALAMDCLHSRADALPVPAATQRWPQFILGCALLGSVSGIPCLCRLWRHGGCTRRVAWPTPTRRGEGRTDG